MPFWTQSPQDDNFVDFDPTPARRTTELTADQLTEITVDYTRLSYYCALVGGTLTATTSGYELLFESQTDVTLLTNTVGLVGGLLLIFGTAALLFGVGPTEHPAR